MQSNHFPGKSIAIEYKSRPPATYSPQMANLYNLEPQPTAKVILNTTAGDLTLELFAKQTPLASRNFLQHCLDGYYTNTIFHRLVPGFIIQGGDPTGTGSGGIPAINSGEAFEDEIHTRLKFNRRGLLGMANEGVPNSNGSQFFFTLDATPELQGKNTMFGRIEGETIYNLMKMADAEMSEGVGSERPMYPTKITGAEILVNPFGDMVARVKEAPRSRDEGPRKAVKRKKPAGKNVLSFGGEEGEEGDVAPVVKKVKANPRLVVVEEEKEVVEKAPREKKVKKVQDAPMPDAEVEVVKPTVSKTGEVAESDPVSEQEESEEEEDRRRKKLDQTNAEIQALKASMKRTVDVKPQAKEKPKSALEAMIPETSTRGRKRGKVADEKGAFDLFNSFKKRLEDLPDAAPETTTKTVDAPTNGHNAEPTAADDEEAALCDLHFIANCQSCKSWDEEGNADADDEDNDTSWMAKKLSFAKDVLGKDLEWKKKMAEIEVIDPREKAREIKEERKKGGGRKEKR